MNIKYDNSMYTSIPPKTLISEPITPTEFLEEKIEEHNFEESYEINETKKAQEQEFLEFKELIKHEPKCRN